MVWTFDTRRLLPLVSGGLALVAASATHGASAQTSTPLFPTNNGVTPSGYGLDSTPYGGKACNSVQPGGQNPTGCSLPAQPSTASPLASADWLINQVQDDQVLGSFVSQVSGNSTTWTATSAQSSPEATVTVSTVGTNNNMFDLQIAQNGFSLGCGTEGNVFVTPNVASHNQPEYAQITEGSYSLVSQSLVLNGKVRLVAGSVPNTLSGCYPGSPNQNLGIVSFTLMNSSHNQVLFVQIIMFEGQAVSMSGSTAVTYQARDIGTSPLWYNTGTSGATTVFGVNDPITNSADFPTSTVTPVCTPAKSGNAISPGCTINLTKAPVGQALWNLINNGIPASAPNPHPVFDNIPADWAIQSMYYGTGFWGNIESTSVWTGLYPVFVPSTVPKG